MNPLTVRPDRLERLRKACLGLPEAAEKIAWGDPTWRVRDKIFAMQKGNYEGGRPSLWLKAPDGAQAALVEGQPERFFVPPYVGHKGWVGVYLDTRSIDWPFIESLIEESYRMIAPRQLAAAADAERPSAAGMQAGRTSERGEGAAVAARKKSKGGAAVAGTSTKSAAPASKKPARASKKPARASKKPAARTSKKSARASKKSARASKKAAARTSKKAHPTKGARAVEKSRTSAKARTTKSKESALTRPRHPMPAFVKRALGEHGLTAAYRARPDYQQNDYLGWISDARQESTQHARLDQMLDELKGGRRYMKMKWNGGSRAGA